MSIYISTNMLGMVRQLVISLLLFGLSACGDGSNQVTIPVQHWKDIDVRVETHPNPPQTGMSEIVVIATGPHGRPESDLIVSLRSNSSLPWAQAIQDGFIGVYRRAIDIGDNEEATLQVRLQQGNVDKVLRFPIKLGPG